MSKKASRSLVQSIVTYWGRHNTQFWASISVVFFVLFCLNPSILIKYPWLLLICLKFVLWLWSVYIYYPIKTWTYVEPREHIALNLGPKDQIWHRPSCNFWNLSLLQLLASLSAFEYTQRFNSFGIAKLVPHLYILPHTHLLSSFPHNFCIEKTPFKSNKKGPLSGFGSCKSRWASRKMLEHFLTLTWRGGEKMENWFK